MLREQKSQEFIIGWLEEYVAPDVLLDVGFSRFAVQLMLPRIADVVKTAAVSESTLNYLASVLRNFTRSPALQLTCVHDFEAFCKLRDAPPVHVQRIFSFLEEHRVTNPHALLSWAQSPPQPDLAKFHQELVTLLKNWLNELQQRQQLSESQRSVEEDDDDVDAETELDDVAM